MISVAAEPTLGYHSCVTGVLTCSREPVTRDWTERPHGALLQLVIDSWHVMYRIGGRRGSRDASLYGVTLGIPPFAC